MESSRDRWVVGSSGVLQEGEHLDGPQRTKQVYQPSSWRKETLTEWRELVTWHQQNLWSNPGHTTHQLRNFGQGINLFVTFLHFYSENNSSLTRCLQAPNQLTFVKSPVGYTKALREYQFINSEHCFKLSQYWPHLVLPVICSQAEKMGRRRRGAEFTANLLGQA